ncbi:MAG: DNA translocase FtsK [Bacteriovoracaceae bacterium]
MIKKILKYQIFSLFVITIFSVIAFYFKDHFPDNVYSISSETTSVNYFSYFGSSFLVYFDFYVGVWSFLSFIIYAGFYSLIYSKREQILDLFHIVFLNTFLSIALNYTFPVLLGEGLKYIINELIATEWKILLFLVCSFMFFYFSFKKVSNLNLSSKFNEQLEKVKTYFNQKLEKFNFKNQVVQKFKDNSNLFVQKLLRGEKSEPVAKNEDRKKEVAALALNAAKTEEAEKIDEIESEQIAETENLLTAEDEEVVDVSEEQQIAEEESETNQTLDLETESLQEQDNFTESVTVEAVDDVSNVNYEEENQELETQEKVVTAKTQMEKRMRTILPTHSKADLISCIRGQKKVRMSAHPDESYFRDIVQRLEDKLHEFKVDAQVINILKGPVVDTFELELGAGLKVSRLTSIIEDLSLALYGAPIRMVYPMKGRTTVGIEVPRNPREIIYLDELLDLSKFDNNKMKLPVVMGKDAFGEPFIIDLAATPHMLVAGSTGAGKSVFINTLLVSLLINLQPSQLKLILIDPKQLELALYSKLPHLLMPVVTDSKHASLSLMWACQEMDRRYSILKELAVRNIEGFNDKIKRSSVETLTKISHLYKDQILETESDYQLPYIVIIIDEFADLILSKMGRDIENNVCRIAAKARACGIHLVLATQRPSVDVITGLIKSNFPTRVSFRVTTGVDSRTILNTLGAEKLLGKGDMLYKQGIEMGRLHSAYIDENEIESLMEKIGTDSPIYDENAIEFIENEGHVDDGAWGGNSDELAYDNKFTGEGEDPLYAEAVKVVLELRTASASMLQRRLKVGYNRAANLVEKMEENGVIGPGMGPKPRKVLVGSEYFKDAP